MDPLSDIVALLKPRAMVSKPIRGRGNWGVRYAVYGRPGFAIMLEGQCWIAIEGAEPMQLMRGDFVLLPSSPAFSLSSQPGIACVAVEPSAEPVRHGDPEGEPDVAMLGGAFQIEAINAPILLGLLPEMIHIRAADGDQEGLRRIVDALMAECAAERPGRDMIVERLLEVMLVECLRRSDIGGLALPAGLLVGLRDPALAKVLQAIHAHVRTAWTVADLARYTGMSRSAFAARFSETLGCGPIEYLARWRMALALDALSRGGKSLDRLADEIGYESASAFSTAFRRRIGSSPGAFARACRDSRRATGLAA
jgi:AraC-like DNA-binding protein